jgi:hypothetical protein
MFHSTPAIHTVSGPSPCRKIFGNGVKDATSPTKLRITTETTYRLMKRQNQQAGGGTSEQEELVRIGDIQEGSNR